MKQLLMAVLIVGAMPAPFILPTAAAAQMVEVCEEGGKPCAVLFDSRGECQQFAANIHRRERADAKETILVHCEEQADGRFLFVYLL